MVQDSDGFGLGGSDLVIALFKVDGVIVVDLGSRNYASTTMAFGGSGVRILSAPPSSW